MPRPLLLVLVLMATVFAGCTDTPEPDETPTAPSQTYSVAGRVLTPAFNPILGAAVTITQPSMCTNNGTCTADLETIGTQTDGDGHFVLAGIWAGDATINVTHPDYMGRDIPLTVPGNGTTNITLSPIDRIVPYQTPLGPYHGYIECGADHLIFSGSCDEFSGEYVGPANDAFDDEREFFFDVEDDWETIVIDIGAFELPPTLEGLRMAAYAPDNSAAVLTYERYHQNWDSEPFTLRIEPGVDYGDALPAPENATTIRVEVFPQGYGYYEACGGDQCFTGVGASARIEFDIVATVFYHEGAPENWSTL